MPLYLWDTGYFTQPGKSTHCYVQFNSIQLIKIHDEINTDEINT